MLSIVRKLGKHQNQLLILLCTDTVCDLAVVLK